MTSRLCSSPNHGRLPKYRNLVNQLFHNSNEAQYLGNYLLHAFTILKHPWDHVDEINSVTGWWMTARSWVSYKLEGRCHGLGDPSNPLTSWVTGPRPKIRNRKLETAFRYPNKKEEVSIYESRLPEPDVNTVVLAPLAKIPTA